MRRYLIVAHQTAESPELRAAVSAIARDHPDAHFVLLVPATPVEHLAVWVEGEAEEAAGQAGNRARAHFAEEGVSVDEVRVGDPNPVYAVKDALMADRFDAVVISTLPIGVSRWVNLDVVSQLRRSVDLPLTHVETAEAT